MNTQFVDDPPDPRLGKARALAADGDMSAAKALFEEALDGTNLASCAVTRLAHLLCTALTLGEQATLSSALSAVQYHNPAVEIAMGDRETGAVGRQGVRCEFSPACVRFVIPANAVERGGLLLLSGRIMACLPMFVAASQAGLVRSGECLLNTADAARHAGLGFCANQPHVHLIPDPDFMSNMGYADFLTHLSQHPVPWAERHNVAFWRGATTGRGMGDTPTWETLHRVQLCEAVKGDHADLFDVGISRLQLPKNDPGRHAIRARGLLKPYVSHLSLHTFRYHIDIDGYVNTWSAFFTKLASGSPVLKVTSRDGWRQWYYDRLIPFENYVPVEADLSDLVEKTRWLMSHDALAEQIGAAGRALALSLTYESQVMAGAATIGALCSS